MIHLTVGNHSEVDCEWCGYPMYVGDDYVMSDSGYVYCCKTCMEKDGEE